MPKEKCITREEISQEVNKALIKYQNLDFLAKFGMFMGVAQLLEFGLKKLLQEKFGYDLDDIEKWTLGKVKNELKKKELRADFIVLLENVIEYRNYIAHEMLANMAIMNSIFINFSNYTKDERRLDKAIYELEQIIFLFDWTNENNGWD